MRWRAWYCIDDEVVVYDSESSSWASLPLDGLQIIVVAEPGGRRIIDGGDWYWLYDGAFDYIPSGDWGTQTLPPVLQCVSCIKRGVAVSDEMFNSICAEAMAWR